MRSRRYGSIETSYLANSTILYDIKKLKKLTKPSKIILIVSKQNYLIRTVPRISVVNTGMIKIKRRSFFYSQFIIFWKSQDWHGWKKISELLRFTFWRSERRTWFRSAPIVASFKWEIRHVKVRRVEARVANANLNLVYILPVVAADLAKNFAAFSVKNWKLIQCNCNMNNTTSIKKSK